MNLLAPTPGPGLWSQPPDLSGCADRPHIAAAFAGDALVRALGVGSVEAVLRESADRSRAVLGLHNPSTAEARINLTTLMPERADCAWHFLTGSMHTSRAADGLYVHLDAAGTVWLITAP